MNIFDELNILYDEIDSMYSTKELDAQRKKHTRIEAAIQKKRELNDNAYFLFLFTRLEDRIKVLSDSLIQRKHTNIRNWSIKRTWDILEKRRSRDSLHLMERVALLTPSGHSDYNLIKSYYDQRNTIAHGGTFTTTISIPVVAGDMKRLYKDLA